MTNVQEALNNALFTIRCYRTEITLDKKRPNDLIEVDLVISKIDAALSEIEKCEPVAYDKNKIRSEVMSKSPIPFGVCDAIDLTMQAMERFITSPQPREWVGLSEEDIRGLVVAQNNARLIEDCLPEDLQKLADAITAKLKQLNTEG